VLFVLFEVARRAFAHGPFAVGGVPLFTIRLRQAVIPALFAAWCFVPYFGITSHPCMTMYSSLSVHSGTTNHLFVPAGLQIDWIQGDLVEISASTSPRFPVGAKLPRLALRKAIRHEVLNRRAPREVSWSVDGEARTAIRGKLPNPSILDYLPMISFNGPVALNKARRRARRRPKPR
jgi:hypothetical protein